MNIEKVVLNESTVLKNAIFNTVKRKTDFKNVLHRDICH